MATLGNVSLRGIYVEAAQVTFLGSGTLTTADVGKAVTLDTGAANTVKLAGDAEDILGQIVSVENRVQDGVTTVGVALAGGYKFTVNPDATAATPDETPAVGDYLEGATNNAGAKGFVQKRQAGSAAVRTNWQVVEVLDSGASVVAIKF